MSKTADKAQQWIGIILTILPWVLKLLGVDVPTELGVGVSGIGGYVAAKADPR
jgi:hypothetical protein